MLDARTFRPPVPSRFREWWMLGRGIATAAIGLPGGIWLLSKSDEAAGLPEWAKWTVLALGALGLPLGLFWFVRLRRERLAAERQRAEYDAIRY